MPDSGLLSSRQQLGKLGELYFKYDFTIEVLNRLWEFYDISQTSPTANIMVLHGKSGSGKTTVAKEFYGQVQDAVKVEGNDMAAIYLSAPSKCTPKALAADLLVKLGDPYADRGTLEQMTRRVVGFINERNVSLVVLDEFQHFMKTENQKVLYDAADWLKSITNQVGCPFLLVGLPNTLDVIDANEQLERRTTDRVELSHFPYKTEEDRVRFRTILALFSQELPFPETDFLVAPVFAEKLHSATDGLIGWVVRLLRAASALALRSDERHLEPKHFSAAFQELHIRSRKAIGVARRGSKPAVFNPFLDEVSASRALGVKGRAL